MFWHGHSRHFISAVGVIPKADGFTEDDVLEVVPATKILRDLSADVQSDLLAVATNFWN